MSTYAVMGKALAIGISFQPQGWGIVPMWGTPSWKRPSIPIVAVGERVCGYLPMAGHLRVEPAISPRAVSATWRPPSAHESCL
ncbi:MAG: DUF2855 family protein [Sphingomonadales bacterium]|nr:DUF2855 family protein [Sphingomonadales bacterium]